MFKSFSYALSDTGKKRSINEDSFFNSSEDRLFIVADGMGGHLAGDVASKLAVESIKEFVLTTKYDKEVTWPFQRDMNISYELNQLIVAIKTANKKIIRLANERNLSGMGTTIVAMLLSSTKASICHVGDSRIYRIRDGKIDQLTEDHSLLNDSIKNHYITEDEIEDFPYKNVITKALGIEDEVEVDCNEFELKENDIFLLCSDGLSNMLKDKLLFEIITSENDMNLNCHKLIEQANANGGADNITAITVQILKA